MATLRPPTSTTLACPVPRSATSATLVLPTPLMRSPLTGPRGARPQIIGAGVFLSRPAARDVRLDSETFQPEEAMPQGSTTLHESEERLSAATRDMHRAIVSLMEELEAVDWYQQRVEASDDGELKEILRHNRDEEKEHAAMVLEWIRRRDKVW